MIRLLLPLLVAFTTATRLSEEDLRNFLKNTYEKQATAWCYKENDAFFNYNTDISNKQKEDLTVNVSLAGATWRKNTWKKYFSEASESDYKDPLLRRQLKELKLAGMSILDMDKLEKLTDVSNKMTNIYSTAKICPYTNQNCDLESEGLSLEPDIEKILAESRDYDELVYVWKSWRDASGAQIRDYYKTYVKLVNEAARLNNFTDNGALWRHDYEDENFVENVDKLWKQVEPLYQELLIYVAGKLKKQYGTKLDLSDGFLPAHIFGNQWAQSWENIEDIVKPFPEAKKVDVTEELINQNYTVLRMFKTADEFYKSLGLPPNDMCYDVSKGAMIEKPTDREVLCHASAYDFCDGRTYKIKMCTKINYDSFVTIHHEMGHIEYFQLYKNQPISFRNGANPGFHEAVGDTIALSVSTPKHLQKIGLLKDYKENYQTDINALMSTALQKVAFLPFGLLIDKWRWDVFNGSVPESRWNEHWWEYRKKYQKVKPPVPRTEEDFDPGAKFHVAGDSQYIAYFVAHILQFQFYKGLCIAAGEYDIGGTVPLHKCDYYESEAAGDKLRDGLSLGSSQHWSKVLQIITGESELNAEPLMEYFEPLYNFLKEENRKYNEFSFA